MRRLNQYSKDLSREVLDLIVSSMNYTKHFKQQNIINFRYVDDTTLMAESKEELKSLLMRVKDESERAGLRLNKRLRP